MDVSSDDQPYNIILAGEFGVGKSSLFRQLSREVHGDHVYTTITARGQHPEATTAATTTTPLHLDKWTHSALVLGDTVKVTLWDTGNLERTGIRNVTRSYFRNAVGVALMYDVGRRESLDALYDWMFRIQESKQSLQTPTCFVVWGNNRDQCSDHVPQEQLTSFLQCQGLSQEDCYYVNTYTGSDVFESYHALLERVHRTFHQRCWDKHRAISQDPSIESNSDKSCFC